MHRELRLVVRRQRAAHAVVVRAQIMLKAKAGLSSTEIARSLSIDSRTVRKWKARFAEAPCIDTLEDRPRSGRPPTIPLEVRCQLVQLACQRPEGEGSPAAFRDVWTHAALADALQQRTGTRVSTSEVGRTLRFEGLKPHLVRQWLNSTDPEFDAKARKVCAVYLRPPPGAVVVCVDEKPLQVLERKHETRVSPHDASQRREYEYRRHGTQALLASFEVSTGTVMADVVPHRSAEALLAFMDRLAARHRGKTIIVVWDNLNTHYDGNDARWSSFNERHGGRFRFVYTPKHASWMNQIEIWFSILQRRVIRHGSFCTAASQRDRILGFVAHWNRYERHPFRWTWRAETKQARQRVAV